MSLAIDIDIDDLSKLALQYGYFGIPSSNINWCETDYYYTYYIAEFWNTLSNIPPIIIVLVAMFYSRKKYSSHNKQRDWQTDIIKYGYIVPMIVFTGSFAFHSTLTYAGQLLDELPMIYGIIYFHWVIGLNNKNYKIDATLYLSLAVIITIMLILLRDSPLPLQISYTVLVILMILRCILIYKESTEIQNSGLLNAPVIIYCLAMVVWLLDVHLCKITPRIEYFYFHAWWHLLSGTATYFLIQFLCANNLSVTNNKSKNFKIGKLFYFLPFVVPADFKTEKIVRRLLTFNKEVHD